MAISKKTSKTFLEIKDIFWDALDTEIRKTKIQAELKSFKNGFGSQSHIDLGKRLEYLERLLEVLLEE